MDGGWVGGWGVMRGEGVEEEEEEVSAAVSEAKSNT